VVQPGNPYQNHGFGGQQPWGQQPQPGQDPWSQPTAPASPGQSQGWGQQPTAPQPQAPPPAWTPAEPGYGPPPDPWGSAPASAPPTPLWPGQMGYPPPPPPPKSNAGLVVALIASAVVVLLLGVIGVIFLFSGDKNRPAVDATSTSGASPSVSPTVSPTPDTIDPASLDDADTDRTSLTTNALFPDTTFTGGDNQTYTLSGTLKTSACTGIGRGPARRLLKKYDCGGMVVGVWLNSNRDLFSALLVIPLRTKDDADSLHNDVIADKQDVINGLTYYCPGDGKPGAKLCKRSADNLPTWYASFTTFHRYLFVAISLYTDGHRTQDMSEVDEFTGETVAYVSDVLLGRN